MAYALLLVVVAAGSFIAGMVYKSKVMRKL
jgi:hypothetical protein